MAHADQGSGGYYWSSTHDGSYLGAYRLLFTSDSQDVDNVYRGYGFSVRAVLAE